jgi:CheY-like chemotaxis protein
MAELRRDDPSTPFPAPDRSRPKIVFAEDNASQRRAAATLLGKRYEVLTVADGLAALQVIQAVRPDVILSDLLMPGLDGRELLEAVRTDPDLCDVPFIVVTAETEAARRALAAGADAHLAKPYEPEELRAFVAAALRARARSAAGAPLPPAPGSGPDDGTR